MEDLKTLGVDSILRRFKRSAVDANAFKRELFAIQLQRGIAGAGTPDGQLRNNARVGGMQLEQHPHALDPEREGLVVDKLHGRRGFSSHGGSAR